jgi:SNF2 family DNA or RNA helicase
VFGKLRVHRLRLKPLAADNSSMPFNDKQANLGEEAFHFAHNAMHLSHGLHSTQPQQPKQPKPKPSNSLGQAALRRAKTAAMVGFEPKDHQREAIERLHANNGSLLLMHGTGTGKTPTSLYGVESLREKGMATRTLAVVPAPLRENYLNDGVHKFTDRKGVKFGPKGEAGSIHISGRVPKADYYVVSNEMFRKDPDAYLKATGADTIVWDEAHKGRSDQSRNYQAMRAARSKVKNFIGLTATPVVNHPRDLVPLVDIVTDGKHQLGTPQQFDKLFTTTQTQIHGPWARFGIGTQTRETMLKNTHHLSQELNKYLHYVPVEDVAKDMPKKVVHEIPVEMSQHQKALYDFHMSRIDPVMAAKIKNNVPVGQAEARSILTKIIRTRAISNSVHAGDRRFDATTGAEATPKMKRMLDDVKTHLDADPQHKAIVYTNLVHGGVDSAVAGLRARGVEPGLFIGSTHQKKSERQQHIKDYLAGNKRVMVLNSAGTEGLNLPGTTAHFTLDPHWNFATIEQAEARGIRAGSPVKQVNVFRYTSAAPKTFGMFPSHEATVDQWVYNVANRKERLNRQLFGLLQRPRKNDGTPQSTQ